MCDDVSEVLPEEEFIRSETGIVAKGWAVKGLQLGFGAGDFMSGVYDHDQRLLDMIDYRL